MLKAILVDCIPPTLSPEDSSSRLAEAESLIKTYGGVVVVKKIQKRTVPDYRTYIGSGKIEEIIAESKDLNANIIIINNALKPNQTYNLNELLRPVKMEAWDRIDIILKIFQKHAQTREAQLEIQLASIKHMGPRIFGMGMQLGRQGGGIGTRGSGETNIEAMKRHLFKLEQNIKKDLEDCKRIRKLHRDDRKRRNLPTVGIIGYTNAGKSSLLNALTHKGAYAADKLFATLDTRVGKMLIHPKAPKNPEEWTPFVAPKEILISDTIGFIDDLPPTLIKSFQSTLEETIEADLLLHVIDLSDPRWREKIEIVQDILTKINVADKPCIYVFNKIDQAKKSTGRTNKTALKKEFANFKPIFVSATQHLGIEDLKSTIAKQILPK